ncbi:hypothetical protein B0H14DRAFT_2576544 [Mycena olivaceomarginata]|nr:hypothetical protein B0H14DRAFT_2576544 [Mycena olivaceomarginata]
MWPGTLPYTANLVGDPTHVRPAILGYRRRYPGRHLWEIKKHNPKESLRAGRGERMAQCAQEEEQMYMRVMAELDAEDDAPDDGEIEIDDSENRSYNIDIIAVLGLPKLFVTLQEIFSVKFPNLDARLHNLNPIFASPLAAAGSYANTAPPFVINVVKIFGVKCILRTKNVESLEASFDPVSR